MMMHVVGNGNFIIGSSNKRSDCVNVFKSIDSSVAVELMSHDKIGDGGNGFNNLFMIYL